MEKNYENIRSFKVRQPSRRNNANKKKGVFQLVCSKNGKRLVIKKELAEQLKLKDTVQFAYPMEPEDQVLLIGDRLPVLGERYSLKVHKNGDLICYNTALVRAMVERFKLPIEERSSFTFYDLTLDEYDGSVIAHLDMEVAHG